MSSDQNRGALHLPSRRPPLRRLIWTLAQLRAGRPLRASDVASHFEVGLRTAYRDLDFLRDEMNAPVEFDRPANTWRLTELTAALAPITLSQGELVALYFAEKVLQQYRDTPYEAELQSAFHKIQAMLPQEVQVRPEQIESYLSLDLGPLPEGDPAIFREVVRGLTTRHTLVVRYHSLNSNTVLDRRLDAYRLFNQRGGWYLAAWDHGRRAVRDFALHRIRRVTVTADTFTPLADFSFEKYALDAFSIEKGGKPVGVAIRFAPRQARWIRERRWHHTAAVEELPDGGCVLRLKVPVSGELTRWVLQFGHEAEVLQPKAFRRRVADELRHAQALYSGRRASRGPALAGRPPAGTPRVASAHGRDEGTTA